MRMAKAGDMALVVGLTAHASGLPLLNGEVLRVLTDPYWDESPFWIGGKALVNRCEYGARNPIIMTARLIPIPPDSESRTLFAAEPADGAVRA